VYEWGILRASFPVNVGQCRWGLVGMVFWEAFAVLTTTTALLLDEMVRMGFSVLKRGTTRV
jgi:hypothetical protein